MTNTADTANTHRIGYRMPLPLYAKAKLIAEKHHLTMAALITESIAAGLDRVDRTYIAAKVARTATAAKHR